MQRNTVVVILFSLNILAGLVMLILVAAGDTDEPIPSTDRTSSNQVEYPREATVTYKPYGTASDLEKAAVDFATLGLATRVIAALGEVGGSASALDRFVPGDPWRARVISNGDLYTIKTSLSYYASEYERISQGVSRVKIKVVVRVRYLGGEPGSTSSWRMEYLDIVDTTSY